MSRVHATSAEWTEEQAERAELRERRARKAERDYTDRESCAFCGAFALFGICERCHERRMIEWEAQQRRYTGDKVSR